MNKHLYNFLDKCEGLPEGTTIKNIEKEKAFRAKMAKKCYCGDVSTLPNGLCNYHNYFHGNTN